MLRSNINKKDRNIIRTNKTNKVNRQDITKKICIKNIIKRVIYKYIYDFTYNKYNYKNIEDPLNNNSFYNNNLFRKFDILIS